ncbi:MAG: hypothetical protein U1E11_10005 [Dethiobacteria bacterium]|nr:hypothetical protein [Dethiobacteria bacterium]
MMNKICRLLSCDEQGMALVLVLVFTAALMVLGTALISFAVNEKLITNYNSLDIRLYYIAEAGAEAGIAILKQNFNYSGDFNGAVGGGTFTVSFKTISSHQREITAVGTLDDYSRKLKVTVEIVETATGEIFKIKEWHRPLP